MKFHYNNAIHHERGDIISKVAFVTTLDTRFYENSRSRYSIAKC
jgi:hypothetical protein